MQRPIYVEIPADDWKAGDEGKIARLEMSLYGTRDAATNWARAVEEALIGIGFKRGIASNCNYRHHTRSVDLTVHGDDFIIVGATWSGPCEVYRSALTSRRRCWGLSQA